MATRPSTTAILRWSRLLGRQAPLRAPKGLTGLKDRGLAPAARRASKSSDGVSFDPKLS